MFDDGSTYEYPSYENSPVKEYEIYAVVNIPYAMQLKAYFPDECDLILPENEYLALNGKDRNAMRVLLDVEDSKEESVNAWLENYTTNVNRYMEYDSKESVTAEYESFGNMIKLVGTVIALILGLIGIMNFANTIITSILVRSRELAMLEAVGMTGKQQIVSLIREGGIYFIWSAAVSLIISAITSVTLIRALTGAVAMFEWKFTLMPLILCLPFLALMVCIIPAAAYAKISERSVVERLRVE